MDSSKIQLKSIESLYDKDSASFKMSQEGMLNFFDNLNTFTECYNNIKIKLKNMLFKYKNNVADPNNSCSIYGDKINNLETIDYTPSNFSNYLLTSKDMNTFIDTSRKLINGINKLNEIMNDFVSDFNKSNEVDTDTKNKIDISSLFNFSSYEGNKGDWNVIGKKDIQNFKYTINEKFFSYTYNESQDIFTDLIEGKDEYPKGTRELGLLFYDQSQIYKALTKINDFIENLKDELLYCPLNYQRTKDNKNYDIESITILNEKAIYFGYPNLQMNLIEEGGEIISNPKITNSLCTISSDVIKDLKKVSKIKIHCHNDKFFSAVERNEEINFSHGVQLSNLTAKINEKIFGSRSSSTTIYPGDRNVDRRDLYIESNSEYVEIFDKDKESFLKYRDLEITYEAQQKSNEYKIPSIKFKLDTTTSKVGKISIVIECYKLKLESFDD